MHYLGYRKHMTLTSMSATVASISLIVNKMVTGLSASSVFQSMKCRGSGLAASTLDGVTSPPRSRSSVFSHPAFRDADRQTNSARCSRLGTIRPQRAEFWPGISRLSPRRRHRSEARCPAAQTKPTFSGRPAPLAEHCLSVPVYSSGDGIGARDGPPVAATADALAAST